MGGGCVCGVVKGVRGSRRCQIIDNSGLGDSEKEFGFDSQNHRKPLRNLC